MATGFSATVANALLNAVAKATNYTAPTAFYLKLHVGDPGSAGTSNPAGHTTRAQVTFGTNASGGAISNTAAVTWTNVTTAEDYTHWSAWDASTSGNFLLSGTMTANAVQVGDSFEIPIGDLDLTLSTAA